MRWTKAPLRVAAGVAACLLLATPAGAQIAPDTPRLISPHGPAGGLGIHWVRAGTLPGDDHALLVTWAPLSLPAGMRIRAGGGRGFDGDYAGYGGVDVQAPVLRREGEGAFALDWYTGLGVGARNYTLVTVPAGLSAGVAWSEGSVWMSPYVSAGLAADLAIGEDAPGNEFEVHPAVDLGLDLAFDRARRFIVRAAASLGDRQAVGVGLVMGGGASRRGNPPPR